MALGLVILFLALVIMGCKFSLGLGGGEGLGFCGGELGRGCGDGTGEIVVEVVREGKGDESTVLG